MAPAPSLEVAKGRGQIRMYVLISFDARNFVLSTDAVDPAAVCGGGVHRLPVPEAVLAPRSYSHSGPDRDALRSGRSMSQQTFRYRVTGRVQGVGYRYFALTSAHRLGIAGFARNLPDGSVEVVAEGAAEAVVAFEEKLREGPAFARVEIVDKEALAERGDQGFHIR